MYEKSLVAIGLAEFAAAQSLAPCLPFAFPMIAFLDPRLPKQVWFFPDQLHNVPAFLELIFQPDFPPRTRTSPWNQSPAAGIDLPTHAPGAPSPFVPPTNSPKSIAAPDPPMLSTCG